MSHGKLREGSAAANPSWAHVLETAHTITIWTGGEFYVWARRELRAIIRSPSRPTTDRKAVIEIPNTPQLRESVERVLWRCLQVRYHDAVEARKDAIGAQEALDIPEDEP